MHGDMSRYEWLTSHRERLEAMKHVERVRENLGRLTPAGKRMLTRLLDTYNVNYGASVNRSQIAALLGRPSGGLTPHDRKLLSRLCELGFLTCERETLWTVKNYPRGAEFRYSMDEDTAWILNRVRRRHAA